MVFGVILLGVFSTAERDLQGSSGNRDFNVSLSSGFAGLDQIVNSYEVAHLKNPPPRQESPTPPREGPGEGPGEGPRRILHPGRSPIPPRILHPAKNPPPRQESSTPPRILHPAKNPPPRQESSTPPRIPLPWREGPGEGGAAVRSPPTSKKFTTRRVVLIIVKISVLLSHVTCIFFAFSSFHEYVSPQVRHSWRRPGIQESPS